MWNPTSRTQISDISLKTADGFEYFKYNEIIHFEADGNYTKVFTTCKSNPTVAMYNLSKIEVSFPNANYYRCHKSHLINFFHLKKFYTKTRRFLMVDGTVIPVSENCLKELRKLSDSK